MTKYVVDLPDDVTCATCPMADAVGEDVAVCAQGGGYVATCIDLRPTSCPLRRVSDYTRPLESKITSQRTAIARLTKREAVYRRVMASKDAQILDLLNKVEGRAE